MVIESTITSRRSALGAERENVYRAQKYNAHMGGERRRREVWENQWAHCELRILKTKKIIVLVIVLVIVMQVYLPQTGGLGDGTGEGEAEGKADCKGVV